ncbi:MAG: FimB/Mfa2 family fimbrial subunit, partial [Duncaniella sp.]|nr:FimB/Mfa2 family fimbrial subunit [Duncaniella sp.]
EDKRKEDVFVKIYNKEGEKIVQVPFIDYALLVKGKYKRPDGTLLTDQEYLDYQDDYSMVFFLDENNRWQNTHIYINSWRVILQDVDM